MARQTEWQHDITNALRRDPPSSAWATSGENRLVKVVRPETVMNNPQSTRAVGYVTQEKYLFGKTPDDIETALGLPPFSLGRGCRIFRLSRLPLRNEFDDELDASMPGGLAFDFNEALEARTRYEKDRSLSEVPYYPPGDYRIPQWNVTVTIPLIHLTDLWPRVAYPKSSL